jgi:hypothetical protein
MLKNILIGCAGSGRVGKDTFANILRNIASNEGYDTLSFAFADALKREIDPIIRAKYGVSAFTQDDEEKKIIRPELVAYGKEMRVKDRDHWVKQIQKEVEWHFRKCKSTLTAVTDCRYANECEWISALGGRVIYIERILENGQISPPLNDEEAKNDPEIRAAADYFVTWPTCLPKSLDNLRPYAQDLWKKIK